MMDFPFPVSRNTRVVADIFIFNIWDPQLSPFVHDRYCYWWLNMVGVFVPEKTEHFKNIRSEVVEEYSDQTYF